MFESSLSLAVVSSGCAGRSRETELLSFAVSKSSPFICLVPDFGKPMDRRDDLRLSRRHRIFVCLVALHCVALVNLFSICLMIAVAEDSYHRQVEELSAWYALGKQNLSEIRKKLTRSKKKSSKSVGCVREERRCGGIISGTEALSMRNTRKIFGCLRPISTSCVMNCNPTFARRQPICEDQLM